MRSMRSMRGGIIFRNRGPSLKVLNKPTTHRTHRTHIHHGQCLTRMTKHDSGGSPPGAACYSAALRYWVKEGVGLVVHFPLEDVAKINTP
jgi:hypothetical protein